MTGTKKAKRTRMVLLSSNVVMKCPQLQGRDIVLIGNCAYNFSPQLVFVPVISFWVYSKIQIQKSTEKLGFIT